MMKPINEKTKSEINGMVDAWTSFLSQQFGLEKDYIESAIKARFLLQTVSGWKAIANILDCSVSSLKDKTNPRSARFDAGLRAIILSTGNGSPVETTISKIEKWKDSNKNTDKEV